ncbi:MAG TPA: carbohydrate binding domain-containing protein [Chthonomonadales bacterium]|nr:carbohydrate binding domain-containing protein [Chthonomonadales bacterium]
MVRCLALQWLVAALSAALASGAQTPVAAAQTPVAAAQTPAAAPSQLEKRWLFVWRDLSRPEEVDRVIARLPRARAAGYNGVAVSTAMSDAKAAELREAARQNGMEIVAIVMGNARDRNYMEGVPVRDALFVVRGGTATHVPDHPTRVVNGGFEEAQGDRFAGWRFQDDIGVTTFADREVARGGRMSLRMENVGRNQHRHARIMQEVRLQPYRQYRITVWVRTEGLQPADAEVKLLARDAQTSISFQTFRVERTQDWRRVDLVFNSLSHEEGLLYVGSWAGGAGKLWWDDLEIEEIGLVNVLRRAGCPVAVRGEDGTIYEEGRDFQRIVDPQLHPWIAYRQQSIPIRLTPETRISDGARLRVSYYHPIIVYEDRLTSCVSEPKVFDEWREEVRRADALLSPAAFLMSHDEMRVMNQCALCRSRGMTPGQLLAANIREAAAIIRRQRPDAGIWVWNDMFDPMHNAVDRYFAVNGSLRGSWEGLDRDVGIVNWHGGLEGRNAPFFAELGLRQILAGYYDSDEDGSAIARWLENTRGVRGIVGAMYTTWEDRYDAMEAWARRAWGGASAR